MEFVIPFAGNFVQEHARLCQNDKLKIENGYLELLHIT
jgi:hypothetical protein